TFWMVTVLVDPALQLTMEALISRMSSAGIDCRPFFYPLSSLPPYVTTPQGRRAQLQNSVSYSLSPLGVNLPCGMRVTQSDVVRVGGTLEQILSDHASRQQPARHAA